MSFAPGATQIQPALQDAGRRRALDLARAARRVYPLLLLLILFGLLVLSVRFKSPTADEQNHLARGLAYLRTGDLRLSQEHPPGINAWAAWPLLLDPRVRLPLESPSWADAEWYGFADQLLWGRDGPPHPQAMVFATRVPVTWLALLLAALAYRWARELGGAWAGGAALTLLAFDPNLLAHGRLTTNDVGLACTVLAASYALWRALRARGGGAARWAVAGVPLGAALLSKFSALALVPISLVILLLAWIAPGAMHVPAALGRRALHLLLFCGVAAFVVWAGYAFAWGPIPALGGLPGPAPAFGSGVEAILRRTGGGSPAFLLGQHSSTGWWYYFPVAFALKTPLATLIVLGLGAGAAIRRAGFHTRLPTRRAKPWVWKPAHLCLVLPPLAFWAMAVAGSFNIGYRHILPSLPFFYILASWSLSTANWRVWKPARQDANRSPSTFRQRSPALLSQFPDILLVLLLAWLALDTLTLAPHYLAHFNALAGGPDNGYRVLVDSNLDWGQDLPGLIRYVQRSGEERIYLSWFGAAHPEAYDLAFHPLPGFWRFGGEAAAYGFNPLNPAPGSYAISATNLQGIKLDDRDLYAWFRERAPDAQVGHSILIYRVEPTPEATEQVVLGVPMAQLGKVERDLLRRAYGVRRYDPTVGLIVPAGDPGAWYASPQAPVGAQVVRAGSGYTVAQLDQAAQRALPLSPPESARFQSVRPLGAQLGAETGAPVGQVARGDTLTVIVRWLVTAPPHRAATSFAHLLDAQGAYLAGWDGLTAPATCWQAGDWIEQRYPIALPPDLPPGSYAIEVGWYDAQTGARWAYRVQDEVVGDRWLLDARISERELKGAQGDR